MTYSVRIEFTICIPMSRPGRHSSYCHLAVENFRDLALALPPKQENRMRSPSDLALYRGGPCPCLDFFAVLPSFAVFALFGLASPSLAAFQRDVGGPEVLDPKITGEKLPEGRHRQEGEPPEGELPLQGPGRESPHRRNRPDVLLDTPGPRQARGEPEGRLRQRGGDRCFRRDALGDHHQRQGPRRRQDRHQPARDDDHLQGVHPRVAGIRDQARSPEEQPVSEPALPDRDQGERRRRVRRQLQSHAGGARAGGRHRCEDRAELPGQAGAPLRGRRRL